MNDKRYVSRSTAIAARVLGDETMVMSATTSTLFTLDEVATVIWEAADGATPLDEIVANKVCAAIRHYSGNLALKDAWRVSSSNNLPNTASWCFPTSRFPPSSNSPKVNP